MIKKFTVFVVCLAMIAGTGFFGYLIAPTFSGTLYNVNGLFNYVDRALISPFKTVTSFLGLYSEGDTVTYAYRRVELDDVFPPGFRDELPSEIVPLYESSEYAVRCYLDSSKIIASSKKDTVLQPVTDEYIWLFETYVYVFFDDIGNFMFAIGNGNVFQKNDIGDLRFTTDFFDMSYFNVYNNICGINISLPNGYDGSGVSDQGVLTYYVETYYNGLYHVIQEYY